jgi:hypothetical protein
MISLEYVTHQIYAAIPIPSLLKYILYPFNHVSVQADFIAEKPCICWDTLLTAAVLRVTTEYTK